jgi:hypothetical protein
MKVLQTHPCTIAGSTLEESKNTTRESPKIRPADGDHQTPQDFTFLIVTPSLQKAASAIIPQQHDELR